METFKLFVGVDSPGMTPLVWPILKRTEKAVQVDTAGGPLWLPLWQFQTWRRREIGQPEYCYHFYKSGDAISLLESLARGKVDSLVVRVWKAGPGPTAKSHKFQVAIRAVARNGDLTDDVRRRCFTLPLSQIQRVDGKWLAPLWLFKDRLGVKEAIARATWPGFEKVRAQLLAAEKQTDEQRLAYEAKLAADRRVEKAEEAKRLAGYAKEAERRRLKIVADGGDSLAYCKKTFTLDELAAAGAPFAGYKTWSIPFENRFNHRLLEFLVDFAEKQPGYQAWRERRRRKKTAVPLA